jgi:putative hydrolase of the HAD superfamily
MSPITAIAFDFGGPVLLTPFERTRALERRLALPEGSLDWRGPFDAHGDPLWRQLQAGDITEREYWWTRSRELVPHLREGSPRELFGVMFDAPPHEIIRPEAMTCLDLAESLELTTAIFTNDLADFQGPEWAAGIPFIGRISVIVDGSLTGVLKPDPRSYQFLIEALDRDPAEILYIDDQPMNIAGGERAGLRCVWLDVTDPARGYRTAAEVMKASI